MRCYTCNTHFCYLCSSWLVPENPYLHFNQRGKGCFMRLWELEEGDDGTGGEGIFGGVRGAERDADNVDFWDRVDERGLHGDE